MLYQISHTTTYTYTQPVTLQPHVVRLRPRSDGWQTLQLFTIAVTPEPLSQSSITDLDGNALIKLWFPQDLTDFLEVQVQSQVATHQSNPFNFLMEPWATKLPIDYPASLLCQLQPYLVGQGLKYATSVDPVALQLAQDLHHATQSNTLSFLSELNQRIYTTCKYMIRDNGSPLPPALTWSEKQGSCRDFAVLFVEVCRAIGLAARFVSGYQEGDLDCNDRHLHAWAEVYLPGAGWRGYDPTHGLAVSDRHIALVASAASNYASPISGTFKQKIGVEATMKYHLQIQSLTS
ncbi:MAG: transglutaminase family protein [Leptolyngbyaceae cyanobacterium CSU_1_3]|nr:transglutaminase family protein [Leptolyngbyaceae cyanobacterium CSU_1_3]